MGTESPSMQWGGKLPLSGAEIDAWVIVAWVKANGGEARYEPGEWGFSFTPGPPRIVITDPGVGQIIAEPGDTIVKGDASFTIERSGQ